MKHRAASLAATVVLLAGCRQEPPTPASEVPFASVCNAANKGRRVAVVGYLRLPPRYKQRDSGTLLRMYEDPRFGGKPVSVSVDFGAQPNKVSRPGAEYGDKDLQVHLAGGGVATLGTRVKVSGEMYVPLVDQTGADGFDCGLTNPLIEPAPAAAAAR